MYRIYGIVLEKTLNMYQSIYSTLVLTFSQIRQVLKSMRDSLAEKFPDEPDLLYIGPSSFLFLRFFCAAILNPQLFSLAPCIFTS